MGSQQPHRSTPVVSLVFCLLLLDLTSNDRTLFVPQTDAVQTCDICDPTNPREIAAWAGD